MKRIAVVTATRAEYGLLYPVIRELRSYENDELKINLIVTGTHLSNLYGFTVEEIDERIDYQIKIPVDSGSELDISNNQAETLKKFSELFYKVKHDAVLLLGDRYETLAVAIAAGNTRTPIFHLCGGDTTEGAMDEWIRHSITKMSYLHFVTNDKSRRRVILMGENPERVFDYGSTSIDNILAMPDMNKVEALNSVELNDCKYALCTYHPETMENCNVDDQIHELLEAIRFFPEIHFIVTESNADQGGARINELLEEAEKNMENIHVYSSLGMRRYLSLMKFAEFVLGNSSSGIIETPAFQVPTINIGDRQRGRLQAQSIINCDCETNSIVASIRHAMSNEHKSLCHSVVSPYGDGMAAKRIAKKTIETVKNESIDLKKRFYDIEQEVYVR